MCAATLRHAPLCRYQILVRASTAGHPIVWREMRVIPGYIRVAKSVDVQIVEGMQHVWISACPVDGAGGLRLHLARQSFSQPPGVD